MIASSCQLNAKTTAAATATATANDIAIAEVESVVTLDQGEVDDLAASIHSLQGSYADDSAAVDDYSAARVSPGDSSCYWDASSMAPLNARSAAAVARLRAFRPPAFSVWDRLPLSRRAAVLVLLYADRRGDLRVVLTMRAASLRNYSGHAAFPGGKADTLDETPEQIARREAWEEIGLPLDGGSHGDQAGKLPRRFRIEHLCSLPHNLAKTELAVRPCVALLTTDGGATEAVGVERGRERERERERADDNDDDYAQSNLDVERLIPRLDAKEVAAVFSAPFHNFLSATDEVAEETEEAEEQGQETTGESSEAGKQNARRLRPRLPPGPWYEGMWVDWHEKSWRMHYFYVPVVGQRVAKPKRQKQKQKQQLAAPADDAATAARGDERKDNDGNGNGNGNDDYDDIEEAPGRYKVWGMTARILVDAAQLAYGERPEFEHNAHFGDEQILEGLERMGRLGEKKPQRELTKEDVKEASKM